MDDGYAHTIAVTTAVLHADVMKHMVYLDLNISPSNETALQSEAVAAPKAFVPPKIEKQSKDSQKC